MAFDNNRYSVNALAVGKTAMVRAYANRIIVVHDSGIIGVHKRDFRRDQIIYDPLHYLEILKRKPGALRNGAPFKGWDLPQPLIEIRKLLSNKPDGDRQFVGILSVISVYGLEAVTAACSEAIAAQTASRDVVFNILGRFNDEQSPGTCETPSHLPELKSPPQANCANYDALLKGGAYTA